MRYGIDDKVETFINLLPYKGIKSFLDKIIFFIDDEVNNIHFDQIMEENGFNNKEKKNVSLR